MPKKYTVSGEPSAILIEQIDEMLEDLYVNLGGSSGHNLLSGTHSDTDGEGEPEAGAVIVGDGDVWTTAVPSSAGTYPRFDGATTNWANISESDITDGTILARVGGNETITGNWIHSGTTRFNATVTLPNGIFIVGRNAGDTTSSNILGRASDTVQVGQVGGANQNTGVSLSTAGTERVQITTTQISHSLQTLITPAGSAAAPTLQIGGSTGYGFYNPFGEIGVAVGGTLRGAFTNNGNINGGFIWNGSLSFSNKTTPAAFSSGNVNFDPTNEPFVARITGNATLSTIVGVTAPNNTNGGRLLVLYNVGTAEVAVAHESASASAATNRIQTATGRTRFISPGGSMIIWYDTTTSGRWREFTLSGDWVDSQQINKTADENVASSTVLQNDDHLTVSVLAGRTYNFRFRIFTTNASAVEGIKWALGGTATVTSLKAQFKYYDGTTWALARVTAFGTTANMTPAADGYIEIDGTVEVNAAGTFLLQWAQQTSGANNATVQRNSSLIVERV